MKTTQTVLFICSGNYYRSRFAEAVFNHRARQLGLAWGAVSRGLQLRKRPAPLAPEAVEGLEERRIPTCLTGAHPMLLTVDDLVCSHLVVALKESEHLPRIARAFPGWERRITFWNIHDIDVEPSSTALPKLELMVSDLVDLLHSGCALGAGEVGPRTEF
ncbi:MAG: hypothetical protein WBE58_20995 [Verrucomicrobiales bacterium]